MKRFVCLLLAFIMLSLFSAGAVIIDDTNAYWANGVHTDGINNDAYDQALMLKKLGLFKGIKPSTGEDGEMTRAEMFECFDLERRMTRLEAAVMYVRFLGAEEKVLSGTWSHPFTDVPEWANPYIGWLFRSGLIKGVSKTRYGSDQPSTFRQYAKFLSLAVCGNENYEVGGVATAEEVNLWDGINGYFSRAAAVGLATRALSLTYTKNGNWTYSMAQFLIHHGVFDSTRLLDAAWGVLPPDYITGDGGVLVLRMAGVSASQTEIGGFSGTTGTRSAQPYFYAGARRGLSVDLYQIDSKTMDCTLISTSALTSENDGWAYEYIATTGGYDYLFEYTYFFDADKANLIRCRDGKREDILPDFRFYGDTSYPALKQNYFVSEDSFVISGVDRYYRIDAEDAAEHRLAAGTEILGYDGGHIVAQLQGESETAVFCIEAETGTETEVYKVPQDIERERRGVDADPYYHMDGWYYGEAGFYILESETGRLRQVTARPTLDITWFRMDYERYIILTHEPGKRVYGVRGASGDEILMIGPDGGESILLYDDPPHGIRIEGFERNGSGGTVDFLSAQDVGMQHLNIFRYVLLPSYDPELCAYDGKLSTIIVTGYTAGRPEMEKEGYEAGYIREEQKRLDALGYGYRSE